eukprot:scaffold3899_cov393-Prasinococcus_capsulatus_cf.AAC.4
MPKTPSAERQFEEAENISFYPLTCVSIYPSIRPPTRPSIRPSIHPTTMHIRSKNFWGKPVPLRHLQLLPIPITPVYGAKTSIHDPIYTQPSTTTLHGVRFSPDVRSWLIHHLGSALRAWPTARVHLPRTIRWE